MVDGLRLRWKWRRYGKGSVPASSDLVPRRTPGSGGAPVEYGVTLLLYGHLHGPSIPAGGAGELDGIEYTLISADALPVFHIKDLNLYRKYS